MGTPSAEEQLSALIMSEVANQPLGGRFVRLEPLTDRPGFFSILFSAFDLRSKRNVVLKFMGPRAMSDPYRAACFDREATICGLLVGKEHIVQLAGGKDVLRIPMVHDASGLPFTVELPYYAIERARESLTSFVLRHKRPRAVYRRLELIRDVVKGIARLHRSGYCHRDLKPDNVLLFARGVAKVADLGTCRLISGDDPIGEPNQYFQPTGSLMYAAPEMYSAAGTDPKNFIGADWFGVGATMFEVVTGQNLYVAIGLKSPLAVRAALTAASDTAGYLQQVGTTAGRYPIPSLADFSETWLSPLDDETVHQITSLIRDLCNFDYRKRLVDFHTILRRLDICTIKARRLHLARRTGI